MFRLRKKRRGHTHAHTHIDRYTKTGAEKKSHKAGSKLNPSAQRVQ